MDTEVEGEGKVLETRQIVGSFNEMENTRGKSGGASTERSINHILDMLKCFVRHQNSDVH